MDSPIDILRLAGTIPFKLGTLGIGRAIGMGRNELMQPEYGYSYTGTPVTIPVPKDIRLQSVQGIQGTLAQNFYDELGKAKYQNGAWWKETPFLWSKIKTPILDLAPASQIIANDAAAVGQMVKDPVAAKAMAESLLKDVVYPNVDVSKVKVMPASQPGIVSIKGAYLADAIKRLPEGISPDAIKLFKSPPFMGMGNYYDISKNEIGLSKLHPVTVYHEFGHAADLANAPWKRRWLRANNYMDRGLRYLVPAAILGADALSTAIPGTVDDKVFSAMKDYGPEAWLAARATGPLMAEFNANRWANKQFADMAATNAMGLPAATAAKTYRNFRLANWAGFGKYLFNTAVPYGLFSLLRSAVKDKDKEMKKESSVADFAKAITEDALLRPLRGLKTVVQNPGVVFEPFERPTAASLGAMITSPAMRELAVGAMIPAGLGALYLARSKDIQQSALAETEAAKLPYYRMLGNMYPGLEVAPWVMDQISERFLT